jgi:hypothetical protein
LRLEHMFDCTHSITGVKPSVRVGL